MGSSQGQQSEQRRQRAQRWEEQMSLVHQAQICIEGSAQMEQVKRDVTLICVPLAGRVWRGAVAVVV